MYSIDGTESSGLARYVNDSPKRFANCSAKVVVVDGQPHVILLAVRDIIAGTELRYDYGGDVPWRKVMLHDLLKQILKCFSSDYSSYFCSVITSNKNNSYGNCVAVFK